MIIIINYMDYFGSMIIITHEAGDFPGFMLSYELQGPVRDTAKTVPTERSHFAMAMCACWMCNRPVAAGWWCNMVQLGYSTCVIKVQ